METVLARKKYLKYRHTLNVNDCYIDLFMNRHKPPDILPLHIFDIKREISYLTKMETKIISFPDGYFERHKPLPLSQLMIETLLAACAKQRDKIPFGPGDIKGSFSALIQRGLIVSEEYTDAHAASSWQVTAEAIEMLRTLGFEGLV